MTNGNFRRKKGVLRPIMGEDGLIKEVLGIFSLTFVFVGRQQERNNSYFCPKTNTIERYEEI